MVADALVHRQNRHRDFMLLTTELRWFYPGTPPKKVTHWFKEHAPGEVLGTPETREDLYLVIPGADYLNVKLRHDRLEIKWRQEILGVEQVGDRWSGQLEKWGKCICEDLSAQVPENAVETGTWVGVEKTRSQRTYHFLGDSVEPVRENQWVPQGCNVELTQVKVRDRHWWSVGLEAFGEAEALWKNLQMTAEFVGKSYGEEPGFLPQNSFAYPHWLSVVLTA